MMVQTKVQIDRESYEFMKKSYRKLNYRSLSDYVRDAVNLKIREDRKRVRELKRAEAMETIGRAPVENLFESIEGDDFEDR